MPGKADIQVLIATLGPDGIGRVARMNLPRQDGVGYLVAWQRSDGCDIPPELSGREDIRIERNPGIGLSDNRNFALDRATGDIVIIADDDVEYDSAAFAVVRRAYEQNPGLDMALFRFRNADGSSAKRYPVAETRLGTSIPKGYYVSSIEITIRRGGKAGKLRFPPEFGIGAPVFGCGEEEIFLRSALRLGCDVRLFPTQLCTHLGATTGSGAISDRRVYRGIGASIAFSQPVLCYLRFPLLAWRGAREGRMHFLSALGNFIYGAMYAGLKVFPKWRKEGRS